MAGVSIPAAPGFNGWTRLREGGWKTMKPDEVEEVRLALEADKNGCCEPGFAPSHGTTYVSVDGRSAHSYHCRSLSRWFNPETRQMEGRKHCTCDSCF